jgi:hypothetical protein
MKFRGFSEALAAMWVGLTDALGPDQRAAAARALEHALEDNAITDPEAEAIIRALIEDHRAGLEYTGPWHTPAHVQ